MLQWKDTLLFKNRDSILEGGLGHFGDSLISLIDFLEQKKPRKIIEGVVGICPARPSRKPPEWIRLYALTSSGSEYGAIRGMEEVLAQFYMRHGILPLVEPIRAQKNAPLSQSHPFQLRHMAKQGAFVYAQNE